MTVFQVLSFDPVKEILKTRCHVLYFHEERGYSERNTHVKMESFAPPLKETKYIHASAAELLHTVLE